MEPTYTYRARVERVVDGDTLDLFVDLGFRIWAKLRVRLHGVNTPETYGVKKESVEYKAGKAATEFVEEWLGVADIPEEDTGARAEIVIRSHDGTALGTGKYGRWLAVVSREDDDLSLNDALLENGHAEPVDY